jgi:hypothetical protein
MDNFACVNYVNQHQQSCHLSKSVLVISNWKHFQFWKLCASDIGNASIFEMTRTEISPQIMIEQWIWPAHLIE